MLYIAKFRGQIIGRSIEKSYHDALQWARSLAGYGVEVKPATLEDLCVRPKIDSRAKRPQSRTLRELCSRS